MSKFSELWGRARASAAIPLALLDQCGLAGATELTRGLVLVTLRSAHPHSKLQVDRPTNNRTMNVALLMVHMLEPQERAAFREECGRLAMLEPNILEVAVAAVRDAAAKVPGDTTPEDIRVTTTALYILATETNSRMHVHQPQADSPPVA